MKFVIDVIYIEREESKWHLYKRKEHVNRQK
jgi:hypothetical protein